MNLWMYKYDNTEPAEQTDGIAIHADRWAPPGGRAQRYNRTRNVWAARRPKLKMVTVQLYRASRKVYIDSDNIN